MQSGSGRRNPSKTDETHNKDAGRHTPPLKTGVYQESLQTDKTN